ncbi:MAG TPA: cob(I)yrinic acid a,c-diamide adenosyltransferase [Gammaproteobacteria bacterium]|nr:cob(I)yrinic acid a,c-diamide adenosyltransferase [Gammaproteobacteria bacterium]
MGHRLTKIYTRTGDSGTTGLANGERVPKSDPRLEAGGTIDETSSALAVVLAEDSVTGAIRASLLRIQNELFEVGGELALPGYTGITAAHVERLEAELDALNTALPPLKDFILPGGGRAAAACHLARAVCRRAERAVWRLGADAELNPQMLRYLNRLSDYLFVAARSLTLARGDTETLWQR